MCIRDRVDSAYKTSETFEGSKVVTTEESVASISGYEIVIGTPNYPAAVANLERLGATAIHLVDVPDFLNIPKPFMDIDFVRQNAASFDRAYELFADDLSRATYIAAINTKINDDLEYIKPCVRLSHLYFSDEFPLSGDEVLLDVGGYTGDSVQDFIATTKGHYRGIISLEPFSASFEKLSALVDALGRPDVTALKVGAWDQKMTVPFATNPLDIDNRITGNGDRRIEVDTIDNILAGGDQITFIKMDINGAEYRALSGARETIRKSRPKIAVKLHVKEDLYRLPLLLKEIAPDIKLYLRQRNFMSMMLVLYGVFGS